jgi:beta-mannosidase
LLDDIGLPKAAFHHLRRVLAPVALWLTDEGLNGYLIHVANDTPSGLSCRLRIALYRDFERPVCDAVEQIDLKPHSVVSRNVEALLGRFVDASWAYRFGPPAHDLVVATLERQLDEGWEIVSQAFCFPAGRPVNIESSEDAGLRVDCRQQSDGCVLLTIRSRRLVYAAHLDATDFEPGDDGFCVEPGGLRSILLRPRGQAAWSGGTFSALNLRPVVLPAAT